MNERPNTILIIGATGSVGRPTVAEALRQGYRVRALVRDEARARRQLPAGVSLVVGDLTRPESLVAAVDGVDAGVVNTLTALEGRPVKVVLMTAVGVTRPGMAFAAWKRRGERLVRASGHDYTIVRPGWFDYNTADQRRIVMRQGDTSQTASPADGVIARDEIARVLIDALGTDAAGRKTLELVAESGAEQDDLTATFAALLPDDPGSVEGVEDGNLIPSADEPARYRADLARISRRA